MSMLLMVAVLGFVLLCLALPAASTITATVSAVFKGVETLGTDDDPFASASAKSVTEDGLAAFFGAVMNAGTTPPVTMQGFDKFVLTAGAGTLDLRAFPSTAGKTKDGNGLKLQALLLFAATGNANPITVTVGASNGYELLGANTEFDLKAGQGVVIFFNDASPDIAAADKTIDFAGTGSQEIWYHLFLG